MNPKNKAISITIIGALLIIASMVAANVPGQGKWFPVALIVGGVLLWLGIQRYRNA